MLPEKEQIFTRVNDGQRPELFKQLLAQRILIMVKSDTNDVHKLVPLKLEKERYLLCEPNDTLHADRGEKLVISFALNSEKYFTQTTLAPVGEQRLWRIDTVAEIFKLQRRQAYRVQVPNSYKSKAVLHDITTEAPVFRGLLTDISSGGCKILVQGHSTLKAGQVFNFEITIGKRDSLLLQGEIRHVRRIEKPQQESLGVMFKSLSSIIESQLFAMTMELHRELAAKVKVS